MTPETTQLPILRRADFHDVPRLFVVEHQGDYIALDCSFDDATGDYPDLYRVVRVLYLPPEPAGPAGLLHAVAGGRTLGTVPVADVAFAPDGRSWIDSGVLDSLMAVVSAAGWTAEDVGDVEWYARFYRVDDGAGRPLALAWAADDGSPPPKLAMILAAPDLRAAVAAVLGEVDEGRAAVRAEVVDLLRAALARATPAAE